MSIRQRLSSKAQKFLGQKSGLPIESYGIEGGELVKNFYLNNGQLIKVNGAAADYSEILLGEAGGVVSLHGFKDCIVAQRGLKLAINSSIVHLTTYEDSGFTMTSTARMYSSAWRDRLVLTNAQDALVFFYTDTSGSFKTFGIDPPAIDTLAASVYFTQSGAGNVDQGELHYMFSLYDSATNTESPCQGSLPSADGIYETSPNGFLGPRPSPANNSAGSTQKMVMAGAGLKSVIDAAAQLSNNRATHFILYRSISKQNGLYPSFFQVPLKDGGDYDGDVLLPISALTGTSGGPGSGEIRDFVDNTAFVSLPAISPPENNSPPPTPARLLSALYWYRSVGNLTPENWVLSDYSGFRHTRFFRDQFFGVGAKSFGFTVNTEINYGADLSQKIAGRITQFNSLLHGSEVYQPDYWPYRWDIGAGDGQEAVALGVLGDVALLCFKEGSTYYLSGSSPDNYVVRIMDTQRGAVHQSTVQETSIGVITLDRSGFILWNKIGQGEVIYDDVHDVIETINFAYAANFYSTYDARLNLYRCSVVTTGAVVSNGVTLPNLTFILDLNSMQWTLEQGSEGLSRLQFSVNSSNITSRAIAEGELPGVTINVGKVYDLVGSGTNGRIFNYSLVNNIATNMTNPGVAPIESVWTSGTINFGDDQHKKRMNWVYLRAKSLTGWKINIEVIPDYDESRKYVLENWDVVSSQSLWYSSDVAVDGSLLWNSSDTSEDGGRWASDGPVRQVSKIPIKCMGYSFQIRIIHRETDATRNGFAIESVSAEGVQLGR